MPLILGRILAIDYGQKRCGIAVTDPMQIIANGLTTVASAELLQFLEKYLAAEIVDRIVVGYPKDLQNRPSESIVFIDAFLKKLTNKYPQMIVDKYDERFTSKIAFQTMIDGGLKKKDRQNKALIDTISAAVLLQSYMEWLKAKQ
jgi:putative holliday junction resolvase